MNDKPRGTDPWRGLLLVLLPLAAGSWLIGYHHVPFADDWDYLRVTQTLYATGKLHFLGFESALLVTQAWAGALVSWLSGGFSIVRMHALTFLFAVLGAAAFHRYLRGLGHDEPRSAAGALILVLNPFFYLYTFTFMTEVPSLALTLVSCLLLGEGLRRRSDLLCLLGSLAGVGGFYTRQFAILMPAAWVIWALLDGTERRRLTLRRFLALTVPLAAAGLHGGIWWFGKKAVQALPSTVQGVSRPWLHVDALYYLGLFVAPLVVALVFSRRAWRGASLAAGIAAGLTAGGLGLRLALAGRALPLVPNQLTRAGWFLRGAALRGARPPFFSFPVRILGTVIAVLAVGLVAGLMVRAVLAAFRGRSWQVGVGRIFGAPETPMHLFALLYAVALVFTWMKYDRYVLFWVPWAVVLLLQVTRGVSFRVPVFAAGAVVFFVISFSLAYNTLTWKRIAWDWAEELVSRGVKPMEIDAGIEWVAWNHAALPGHNEPKFMNLKGRKNQIGRSWYTFRRWSEFSERYVIAFSGMRHFRKLREVSYRQLPFLNRGRLLLLEQATSNPRNGVRRLRRTAG